MSDSDELPIVAVPASASPSGSPSMDVLAADSATPRRPSAKPAAALAPTLNPTAPPAASDSGAASALSASGATGDGPASAATAPSDAGNGAAGATPAKKPGKRAVKKAASKPAKGSKGAKAKPAKRPAKKRATATTSAAAVAASAGGVAVAAETGAAPTGAATTLDTALSAGSSASATSGTTARKAGSRRPPQPKWVTRLFAPPNIDGPRARFGIIWVLFAVPAVYFGAGWVAALYGLHAGIAALQTGQAWRRDGYKVSRLVAAPAAVAMPVLAVFSYQAPGVVVLALPVVAMSAALVIPRRRRKLSAAAVAGATLRSAVPAGTAAMGMVFVARLGPQTGLVFLGLITAYDLGWFVFGAETRSGAPGVIMGAVTSLACTGALVAASVFVFKFPPFDGSNEAWVFGALIAVLAPLGQLVASLSLPTASSWVPALRRLDSYILAAPVWAWVLWTVV